MFRKTGFSASSPRERRCAENGNNPADSPTHDQVNPDGSNPDDGEDWWKDPGWWADTFNYISIGAGFASAALVFPPAAPVLGTLATISSYVSVVSGALSALFTGFEHGFLSGEFAKSAASAALGPITFGQSKWIGALSKAGDEVVAPVTTKLSQFAHDLVSPITGPLSL